VSLPPKPVREVSAKWGEILLVCRKCSKKLHGGFGEDGSRKLDKVLSKALKERGRKDVKIVSVGCLDICPKNAVTVVKASEPARVFLVGPAMDASQVLGTLDL
jgi:predicted metal-binding protein